MNVRTIGFVALAAAMPVSSAQAQVRLLDVSNPRLIEVIGEASVEAKPDFARVTLGVTTSGKDAREAMAANAKTVNDLISLIKAEGVAATDIQTSNLSVSPQFSNAAQSSPHAQTIVGYSVNNTVTVTARDLTRLGALIDKAVDAGANTIYGIAYGENDPGALLDKARPAAVADARRKAEIYAAAGGAKVGRLMIAQRNVRRPAAGYVRQTRRHAERGRADPDRGRRRQADGRHHGAVRAHAIAPLPCIFPGGPHVPQYPPAVQLRTARERGGDSRLRAAIRAQGQRLLQALANQCGGLRSGGRGGRRDGAKADLLASQRRSPARPANGSIEGARAIAAAFCVTAVRMKAAGS